MAAWLFAQRFLCLAWSIMSSRRRDGRAEACAIASAKRFALPCALRLLHVIVSTFAHSNSPPSESRVDTSVHDHSQASDPYASVSCTNRQRCKWRCLQAPASERDMPRASEAQRPPRLRHRRGSGEFRNFFAASTPHRPSASILRPPHPSAAATPSPTCLPACPPHRPTAIAVRQSTPSHPSLVTAVAPSSTGRVKLLAPS